MADLASALSWAAWHRRSAAHESYTASAAERLSISMSTSAGAPVLAEAAVFPLVWGRGFAGSCLCSFPGCTAYQSISCARQAGACGSMAAESPASSTARHLQTSKVLIKARLSIAPASPGASRGATGVGLQVG